MNPTVEVRDLTQRFDDVVALDGVTFRLEGNGIYGLLGRNASGKTTLLSLVAGFRKPTAGEVLIGGEPVFENGAVTREICLIREGGDTVDGSERVKSALAFATTMRPHWDNDYALALLERFELSPEKKIGQLSRGQRAAMACTLGLAARAPFTMFDEAYLGLDAPWRYAFYDALLQDHMEHPRTVIISTHLIEEVSALFEQVVMIDHGRLVLHEDAEALRARGVSIVGPAAAVDAFVAPFTVLSRRTLGPTASAVIVGTVSPEARAKARAAGLEMEAVPLQDLFVHLTTQPATQGEES